MDIIWRGRGVVEGCQEWRKKLLRGEEGKNKRVVDSFTLQHPILDYISGSCFLCVVLWPGTKKKLLKFHLICCRNSSVCLYATQTRGPKSTMLSDNWGKITLIISLSVAIQADILCNQRRPACAAGAWEAGPLAQSRGKPLMVGEGARQRPPSSLLLSPLYLHLLFILPSH